MKKALLFLFLVSLGIQSWAQQDPLYSQYLLNPVLINPAYTGFHEHFVGTINSRFQWVGIDEGNPQTFTGTASTSLFDNKMGAGIIFVRDELGANINNEFYGTYSYKIQAFEGDIIFGLQAGMINYQYRYNELTRKFVDDPEFPINQEGASKFNFGTGGIYVNDNLFLGISIPRLLNSEVNDGVLTSTRYRRHFYGYGAYLIDINPLIKFKPAVLMKGVAGAPLSFDLNFNVIYSQRYSAGLFTRNLHSYGMILQFDVNDNFHFGYSYELYNAPVVQGISFSTHELMLRIDMAVLPFHDLYKSYF